MADNLNIHAGTDLLLFVLAHPRWEIVFQPTYAAYLNLIEPWWKVLRSLAVNNRRVNPPASAAGGGRPGQCHVSLVA